MTDRHALAVHALALRLDAMRKFGLAIFSELDPVRDADMRTSLADLRELSELRVREAARA